MSTVILSRPLRVIDKDVTELTFREPTGADLVKTGYPVRVLPNGATEIDADAMTKLIARLAGIPAASAGALPIADWNACMAVVTGFFGASAPTSSTDTSRPRASGATS